MGLTPKNVWNNNRFGGDRLPYASYVSQKNVTFYVQNIHRNFVEGFSSHYFLQIWGPKHQMWQWKLFWSNRMGEQWWTEEVDCYPILTTSPTSLLPFQSCLFIGQPGYRKLLCTTHQQWLLFDQCKQANIKEHSFSKQTVESMWMQISSWV